MINQFREVLPINRNAAEDAFNSNNSEKICNALIRLTYYDPDYRWVQNKCIDFLGSDNIDIKRIAIICLGHLARIHKKLDKQLVIPLLQKLREDQYVGGIAEDALNDIDTFLESQ